MAAGLSLEHEQFPGLSTATMGTPVELSVVVPVYNEAGSLPLVLDELHAALTQLERSYEIILIDDGSTDRSFAILAERAASDAHLRVCRFRRNFGQTAALQAGIDAARGEIIVLMDADLQNDPADIALLLEQVAAGGDLVAGWRRKRKDPLFRRRLPSWLANWLIRMTTGVPVHDFGCTLKAIRRDVAKSLRLYGEMHRFIPAIASWVGARIIEVEVHHRGRRFGRSKYGLGRTLRVILDLVTVLFLRKFLDRPMQFFGFTGLLSGVAGFGVCTYLAAEKLFYDASLADRPLLLLGVMLMLVGVQLLSLGLVADVVGRTYHEAQGKPPYHVREWLGTAPQANAAPPGARSAKVTER